MTNLMAVSGDQRAAGNWWRGSWNRFTTPLPAVQDTERRQKARLLASLLLLLLVCLVPGFILLSALDKDTDTLILRLVGVALLWPCYVLSRQGHIKFVCWLLAAIGHVLIFSFAAILPEHRALELLYYLCIISMFTSLFLTLQVTLGLVVIQLAAMVILPIIASQQIRFSKVATGPFTFIVIAALFILLVARHRDLLEMARQRQLLIAEEQRARTEAFSLVMVTHTALDGRWLKVPPTLCELLGYREAELLNMTFRDVTHPDDLPEDLQQTERLLNGTIQSFDLEKRYLHKDGQIVWVYLNCSLVTAQDGTPQYLLGFIRDITARKQAEQALRDSQALLSSLIESLPQSIISKDLAGRFTFANRHACEAQGLPLAEILGKTDFDLHPLALAEKYQADDRWVIDNRRVFETIEDYHPLDQQKRHVHVIKAPICDAGGSITGVLGIFWDVTERIKAEEQVRASLHEKEVLLKEIHHRVKNNLQIISSLLSLQTAHVHDPQALVLFRESQNRIRSMALTHELLYQSTNLANINFQEYVRRLTDYLLRTYSNPIYPVSLTLHLDEVGLSMDSVLACGLIINELVSNALKYAFPADYLAQQPHLSPEICITLRPGAGALVSLSIQDNGVGLPSGFDLAQSKSLGLQLVTTLAQQLEGRLEIERGHPTQFRLIFPQALSTEAEE